MQSKQYCKAPASKSIGCCHGDGELAIAASCVTLTQSWCCTTHCSISEKDEKILSLAENVNPSHS